MFIFSNRIGIALSYILMYIVAKYIQIYLLPTATGIIAILMIMFSYTTTRMLPVLMMGYYTVTTTKVSEFIVSMEKAIFQKRSLFRFQLSLGIFRQFMKKLNQ